MNTFVLEILTPEKPFFCGECASVIVPTSDGMVSAAARRVRVLCESAVFPEEIDEEKERLRMQEAELEMRKRQSYEEYVASQLAFAKAFNRLKVKQYSAMQTNRLKNRTTRPAGRFLLPRVR